MTRKTIAAALLIAGTLAAGGAALAQQPAATPQPAPAAAGAPVLTMQEVMDRLTQEGWRDIKKIEHERGKYEVKARGADGVRMELDIDDRTGAILKQKRD